MLSTAIGYVSSVLRKPDVREQFPALTAARTLLDRSVENLRTVSHNLMPKNFAQLGLSQSLAETIDKVAHTSDVAVAYVVVGTERRLSAATEVQIFRIAAELINDILKNSAATQATVQLIYNHDHLSLMAEDDAPRTPAYNNLTSKVQFLNGTLAVDTTKTGVTAVVEIPYHEPDEWKHQPKS
jgi:signal transduction histidine kinase